MNYCKICGNTYEKKATGSHLNRKHGLNKIEYLVKYEEDNLDYVKKNVLYDLYYKKKMSVKKIAKLYEKKYDEKNLKKTILDLMKYYGFILRTTSEAQKNFIDKSGGVWNKGLTKKDNDSVRRYASKKKQLYRDLHDVYENMSIDEIINCFGITERSTRYKIIKKKLLERQDGKCLLCKKELDLEKKREAQVHHIDRNHNNNKEENLCIVCISCHMKINGHKHRLMELDKFNTYELLEKNIDEITKILENKIKRATERNREDYIGLIKKDNCYICGNKNNLHIHHINNNVKDNRLENLCCLCHSCHSKITGRGIVVNNIEDMRKKFIEFKNFEGLKWNLAKVKISNIPIKEFIASRKLKEK